MELYGSCFQATHCASIFGGRDRSESPVFPRKTRVFLTPCPPICAWGIWGHWIFGVDGFLPFFFVSVRLLKCIICTLLLALFIVDPAGEVGLWC